jgi:hypothetical protein
MDAARRAPRHGNALGGEPFDGVPFDGVEQRHGDEPT